MMNASTHADDEIVLQANRFISTSKDRKTAGLVRALLNRIGEKKVEMRGLEGQISTLTQQRDEYLKEANDLQGYVDTAQAKIEELETMLAGD